MSTPKRLLPQISDDDIAAAYTAQQRMLRRLAWKRTEVLHCEEKRSSLHAWLVAVEHAHDEIRASLLMHEKGDIDTLMVVCEDKNLYFHTIHALFDHPHDPSEFSERADDNISINDSDDEVDFVITTGDKHFMGIFDVDNNSFFVPPMSSARIDTQREGDQPSNERKPKR